MSIKEKAILQKYWVFPHNDVSLKLHRVAEKY